MDFKNIMFEYELDGCMRMLRLQQMLEQNGVVSVLDSQKALITVYVEERDKEINNPFFMSFMVITILGSHFLILRQSIRFQCGRCCIFYGENQRLILKRR